MKTTKIVPIKRGKNAFSIVFLWHLIYKNLDHKLSESWKCFENDGHFEALNVMQKESCKA